MSIFPDTPVRTDPPALCAVDAHHYPAPDDGAVHRSAPRMVQPAEPTGDFVITIESWWTDVNEPEQTTAVVLAALGNVIDLRPAEVRRVCELWVWTR